MITQVKYLTEALQRFNPEARLEFELDVRGISPQTECTVTVLGENPKKLADVEEELEASNESVDGLKDDREQIVKLVETLKSETLAENPVFKLVQRLSNYLELN